MPQRSVFQSGGLSSPSPRFPKNCIFFRVLERFSIVLEFLTLFKNSSANFRIQLKFKKKFWILITAKNVIRLFFRTIAGGGGGQNSAQNSWNFSKFGFEKFWGTLTCHSFLDFDRGEK